LKSINRFIFVMVKCCVFFSVRTEFLNIILASFSFRGLNHVTFENQNILCCRREMLMSEVVYLNKCWKIIHISSSFDVKRSKSYNAYLPICFKQHCTLSFHMTAACTLYKFVLEDSIYGSEIMFKNMDFTFIDHTSQLIQSPVCCALH
jgi:hypothetical protein